MKKKTLTFGEKLRAARTAAGLTQHAAAAMFGVSAPTWIMWEKDPARPPPRTVLTQEHILDRLAPSFGEKLTALRKRAGLTQVQFGESVGVSEGTVGYWEANKRVPPTEADAVSQQRLIMRLRSMKTK